MAGLRTLFPAVLLLAGVVLGAAPAAAKTYRAERFDVEAEIQLDRSLLVRETVVFRFDGGPFTTAYRKIPAKRTDGIAELAATFDGRPVPRGSGPGQVEIREGNLTEVIWHFAPATDRTHTLGLRYRLRGVIIREDDYDLLTWHVLPTEHSYVIDQATAAVAYPVAARLVWAPRVATVPRKEAKRAPARLTATDGALGIQAAGLRKDASLRLSVALASGVLSAAPPAWQLAEQQRGERGPLLLAVAAAVLVAGLGWLTAFWAAWRRPEHESADGPREMMPPDPHLPVAMAGHLSGGQRGRQALATLFDLARRGAIRVVEEPRRSRWSSRQFTLQFVSEPAGLPPHERVLLETAFGPPNARQRDVSLGRIERALASRPGRGFHAALASDLTAAGFVTPDRLAARRTAGVVALWLAAVGTAALVAAAVLSRAFGGWAFAIPIAFFLVAAATGIVAGSLSPLSTQGARHARRWRRFSAYLKDVAKGRSSPSADPEWLPYAVAAGAGAAWAKMVTAAGLAPAWFRAAESQRLSANDAFVAFAGHSAGAGADGSDAATAGAASGAAAGGGSSGAS